MTFEEKLRMRDKLLKEFAQAGQVKSQQILRTAFCEFNDKQPKVVKTNFDGEVLIHIYKAPLDSGFGKVEGFHHLLIPNKIFLNASNLRRDFIFGSTLRHEHIHYLQHHAGMEEFAGLEECDVRRFFKNPVSECTKEVVDQVVYLTGEDELMPRLDQIVTTFSAMGGRLPMNRQEFDAFLWVCDIRVEKEDPGRHQKTGRSLLPKLNDDDMRKNIRLFSDYCHDQFGEIQRAIMSVKAESRAKIPDLLYSSYSKLLTLYGYDIDTPIFLSSEKAQLTCTAAPILSAS